MVALSFCVHADQEGANRFPCHDLLRVIAKLEGQQGLSGILRLRSQLAGSPPINGTKPRASDARAERLKQSRVSGWSRSKAGAAGVTAGKM